MLADDSTVAALASIELKTLLPARQSVGRVVMAVRVHVPVRRAVWRHSPSQVQREVLSYLWPGVQTSLTSVTAVPVG